MIVGRDHASPGVDSTGKAFYPPYAAQELLSEFSEELGVGVLPFQELVYSVERDRYLEVSEVKTGERTVTISGTEVRQEYLEKGVALPGVVFATGSQQSFTGNLPAAARAGILHLADGAELRGQINHRGDTDDVVTEHGRRVTLLDGDVVRTNLSAGLGFSKKDQRHKYSAHRICRR